MDSGHDTVYGGNSQSLMSSGVGDVVLPVQKKKNRLPLIIAIVAVVLIAGVGILIWALALNRSAPTVANLQTVYNRYANYLIYGEDSTKNLEGEYDRYGIYALHDALNNEDRAYFNKLNELLNNYFNMAGKMEISNLTLIQANTGIASAASFVVPYGKKGVLGSEDLLKLVVEKGSLEDVNTAIEEFYKEYAEDSSTLFPSYYDYITEANKGEAEIIYAYKDAGCIEGGKIVYEGCEMTFNYAAQEVENDRNYYWAQTFIDSNIRDIIRYTWQAKDGLAEWMVE